MFASRLVRVAALALVVALFSGCASTPTLQKAAPGVTFQQPVAAVERAAVEALSANGFTVTKQDPTYVEGTRPHKVGLFVGSGGETAGVWLTAHGADATEVRVETAKSFAGRVGQKDWDAPILASMRQSLAK